MFNDLMLLKYKFRYYGDDDWQSVTQEIRFDHTSCNYGGEVSVNGLSAHTAEDELLFCMECLNYSYAANVQM